MDNEGQKFKFSNDMMCPFWRHKCFLRVFTAKYFVKG